MLASRMFILLASLLWSLSGLFSKSLSVSGPTMACYRALAAGLVLWPFVRRSSMRLRPAMFVMVICFAVMGVSFITAMTLTTAANVIFLQYTSPVWILLGSVLWLGERVEKASLVSIILALLGVIVILLGQDGASGIGMTLALVAGIAYAGVVLCLRHLRTEDAVWLTFINHLGSGIILFVVLLLWTYAGGSSTQLLRVPAAEIPVLIAFGAMQMALPYLLFSRGMRQISAQEAGIITLVEPILNPLITFLALGEKPAAVTLVGGAIILSGLVCRYVPVFLAKAPGGGGADREKCLPQSLT